MKTVKRMCAALLALIVLTLCGCSSYVRLGYVGMQTGRHWSGSYKKLDGHMTHRMRAGDAGLRAELITEEGDIALTVTGADGESIFFADAAGTYIIEAAGKVTVRIDADDHRGSFDIRSADDEDEIQ